MEKQSSAEAENRQEQSAGSDAAIEKAVLDELARSYASISPRRLAQGAAALARVPEYRVMAVLRHMLEQGTLVLKHGRIRCLRSTPVDGCARCGQDPNAPRDWDYFRQLLLYYDQCLRADDSIECMAFDNGLDKHFTYLYRTGHWFPRQGHVWSMTFSLDQDNEWCSSLRSQDHADPDLVLGYPVYASVEKTEDMERIRLVPVFLHKLHLEPCNETPCNETPCNEESCNGESCNEESCNEESCNGESCKEESGNETSSNEESCNEASCNEASCNGGMKLTLLSQAPMVNPAWLAQLSPTLQRHFLRLVGMDQTIDEVTGDESKGKSHDFASLAPILTNFAPHLVREPLTPTLVQGTPLDLTLEQGIYNRALVLPATKTTYTSGLIRELEEIRKAPDSVLDKTALKYFFLDAEAETTPMHEGVVADTTPLSPEQRRAVASLLSMPLTVVQGPPGTGKSQVAAATCANARLLGQSVLVSSSTHNPLDALMAKLALDDGFHLAVRCDSHDSDQDSNEGNNEGSNDTQFDFADAIEALLEQGSEQGSEQGNEQNNEQSNEQSESDEEKPRFQDLARELQEWLEKRSSLIDQARDRTALARRLGELDATITRVESVLPPELLEKARKRSPLSRSRLARFTMAGDLLDELGKSGKTLFKHFVESPLAVRRARRLLRWYKRLDPLTHIPRWFAHEDPSVLDSTRTRLALAGTLFEALKETRELKQRIGRSGWRFEDLIPKLEEIQGHVAELTASLLALDMQRRKKISGERQELADLSHLLRQDESRGTLAAGLKAEEFAKDILFHTPVWAVSSRSVDTCVPLSPGIFDLVLIDEASQSSIPSLIPLLFRARRAGIVGDPRQLPFTTSLTPDDDVLLMRRLHPNVQVDLRFSFPATSSYDLACTLPAATSFLLDETWRSARAIADYSSRLFYDGKLAAGTDEGALRTPQGMDVGIVWRDVQGAICRDPKGGNVCEAEIDEIEALVLDILKNKNFDGTLGVVSPFREQSERIREQLLHLPGLEHEKRERLAQRTGTVHHVQKDGYDVLIFSLCAGPDLAASSLHFLQNVANLFNVAAGLAKSLLIVVGNRDFALSCGIPHIVELAKDEQEPASDLPQNPWAPFRSPWEKRLHDALEQRGITVIPQYRVGAGLLDLALVDPKIPELKLDIEVDGDSHFTAGCEDRTDRTDRADDHWRDLALRELGWRVLRFWTFELTDNLERCLDRVERTRDEMLGKQS